MKGIDDLPTRARSIWRQALWQLPVIILMAGLVGISVNYLRPDSIPVVDDWPAETSMASATEKNLIIPLPEATRLFSEQAVAFAETVYRYQILPDWLINLAALVLPWLELFLGIFLIIGLWMPGAIVISNLLFIIFMGTLSYNMARGLDISCGCFSTSPTEGAADIWTVLRDGMFLAVSLCLLLVTFRSAPRKSYSLNRR